MAVVMTLELPGVTLPQYEEIRRQVQWENNPPDGAMMHVAAFDMNGLRVVDLWESEEAFEKFFQQRLLPAAEKIGIRAVADYEVLPVHALANFKMQPGHTPLDPAIASVPS